MNLWSNPDEKISLGYPPVPGGRREVVGVVPPLSPSAAMATSAMYYWSRLFKIWKKSDEIAVIFVVSK